MTTQLQIFNFESAEVRIIEIDGKEWFCAIDICRILGYANGRDAVARHCKQKGVAKHDTLTDGGMQELSYIDEGNVIRLITSSKLPQAEKFESWVFEEVLPSIRKTGSYLTGQQVKLPTIIELAQMVIKSEEEKHHLELKLSEQQKKLNILAPKIELYDKLQYADGLLNLTNGMKALHLHPNKAMSKLRQIGYLREANIPYQKYIDMHLFEVKTTTSVCGSKEKIIQQTFITAKGIHYFREKIRTDLKDCINDYDSTSYNEVIN